jgi:hypothetical protein
MDPEARLPLGRRLWIYLAERFPLGRHGPLIVVFCGAATLYGARLAGGKPAIAPLLASMVCAGGFFLLMRLADEGKDRHEDRRWRPYRPVPRGLVSLRELAGLGALVVLVQGGLALAVAPAALPFLLLGWGWFALMGWEFFRPAWLRARPLLYTLSHMVMVPLIALIALAFGLPAGAPALAPFPLLWLLCLCYLNGLAIEFARKIRPAAAEEPGVETWSALWGLGPARGRWLLVVVVSLPVALLAGGPVGGGWWVLLLLAPLLAWILLGPGSGPPRPGGEPLALPTALWTLATYLALGWLPALPGIL